jgi:hypothetical protein
MKHIAVAVIVAAFALHAPLASADTSTAPGQQKKEAGAQSAKEYAPGQEQEHGKPKAAADHGKKAKKRAKQPDVAAPGPGPAQGKKK